MRNDLRYLSVVLKCFLPINTHKLAPFSSPSFSFFSFKTTVHESGTVTTASHDFHTNCSHALCIQTDLLEVDFVNSFAMFDAS